MGRFVGRGSKIDTSCAATRANYPKTVDYNNLHTNLDLVQVYRGRLQDGWLKLDSAEAHGGPGTWVASLFGALADDGPR